MGGPKAKDLTDGLFGRWRVIRRAGSTRNHIVTWLCKCECGNEKVVRSDILNNGQSQSCGCLNSEISAKHNRKHGYSNISSPEYFAWCGMKARCNSPTNKDYHNYGGRGIKVCQRWLANFENFLIDMGLRPADGLSLERMDVNGNYEPTNCVWATATEQIRNRRPSDTWGSERQHKLADL